MLRRIKRYLCILSGEDIQIIMETPRDYLTKFSIIGLIVAVVFISCFFAMSYSMTLILNDLVTALLVGCFFALMISNIYLLLLYTLGKSSVQVESKGLGAFVSKGGRVLFICFVAVIVGKCLEVYILKNSLDADIAQFKIEKFEQYSSFINDDYSNTRQNLEEWLIRAQETDNIKQVRFYRNYLNKIEEDHKASIIELKEVINNATYYVHRIRLLISHYPQTWVITLLLIILFLIPVFLKSGMGHDSDFFSRKIKIERRLILDEFIDFKNQYQSIFKIKFGTMVEWVDKYSDPPFNQNLIEIEKNVRTQDDLICRIYPNETNY